MQDLLKAWTRAIAEQEFHEACAFCATPAARNRALFFARKAERRAAEIAQVLRKRYNVDPYAAVARGEIK